MEFDLSFSQNITVHKGDVLLAEPLMRDPNFERSAIILCEHKDEEGTFGLIVNKPSMMTVGEVTEELPLELPLYVGGPVEQNTLHFIHSLEQMEGAIPLKDGLFWGGSHGHLKELAQTGQINDDNCRFFMGYSGWSSYQLKEELERKSWIVTHVNLNSLLGQGSDAVWRKVLQAMGGKYKVMANYPLEPRMN